MDTEESEYFSLDDSSDDEFFSVSSQIHGSPSPELPPTTWANDSDVESDDADMTIIPSTPVHQSTAPRRQYSSASTTSVVLASPLDLLPDVSSPLARYAARAEEKKRGMPYPRSQTLVQESIDKYLLPEPKYLLPQPDVTPKPSTVQATTAVESPCANSINKMDDSTVTVASPSAEPESTSPCLVTRHDLLQQISSSRQLDDNQPGYFTEEESDTCNTPTPTRQPRNVTPSTPTPRTPTRTPTRSVRRLRITSQPRRRLLVMMEAEMASQIHTEKDSALEECTTSDSGEDADDESPSQGHANDDQPPRMGCEVTPSMRSATQGATYMLHSAYGDAVEFPAFDPTGRTGRYRPHHRDEIIGLKGILKSPLTRFRTPSKADDGDDDVGLKTPFDTGLTTPLDMARQRGLDALHDKQETPDERHASALKRVYEPAPSYIMAKAMKPTVDRLKRRIEQGSEPCGPRTQQHFALGGARAVEAELERRGLRTSAQKDMFFSELAREYSRLLAGTSGCLLSMWKKMMGDLYDECMEIAASSSLPSSPPQTPQRMTPFEALLAHGQGYTDESSSSDDSDLDGMPPVLGQAKRVETGLMTPVSSPAGRHETMAMGAVPCKMEQQQQQQRAKRPLPCDEDHVTPTRTPKRARRLDAVSAIVQRTLGMGTGAAGAAAVKSDRAMTQRVRDVVEFHAGGGWKKRVVRARRRGVMTMRDVDRAAAGSRRRRDQEAWRGVMGEVMGECGLD